MKKVKSTLAILMLILSVFSSAIGCSTKGTDKVAMVKEMLGLAREIVGLITTFTDESDKFSKSVQDVTNTVSDGIENKKVENVDIIKFWEKYWMDIHVKYEKLEATLNEISIKSNLYFTELYNNNSKISSIKSRQEDNARNAQLLAKWQSEYNQARKNLNDAKNLLKTGDDFKWQLRNKVLRDAIKENIADLQNISLQAQALSESIKLFEANTKNLFIIN